MTAQATPEFDREAYKGIHARAEEMRAAGARLITIIARDNGDGTIELLYIYDREGRIVDYRYIILPEWEIETIADVYSGAVNLERENVDLFGLRFRDKAPGLLLVPGKSMVNPLRKSQVEKMRKEDTKRRMLSVPPASKPGPTLEPQEEREEK